MLFRCFGDFLAVNNNGEVTEVTVKDEQKKILSIGSIPLE